MKPYLNLLGLTWLCGLASVTTNAAELPRVPAGFTIEVVAEHPLVTYPMMAGFDDRGRLFVAENAGVNHKAADLLKDPPSMIRLLEDTDHDGKFDKTTLFADKLTLPMGALWYRGALYVASPPCIWKLEDTNDDGVADKRTAIVKEFGFSGNAASIHGCFPGLDGRIYWCDGRHGHEFKDAAGNITSKGLAARIFSCRPDGSDVQVFCGGGMDNPVEIDFMPTGEMLGTVNILLNGPRVDCLMHWVEGGNYPHYPRAYSEFPRTGDLLEPMTRLGHVAVSGMTRYRSSQFGKQYENNVFTSSFNLHKIVSSSFTRTGSTFQTVESDFLVSDDPDFHPTDVIEDADGSLLVINTGGWFRLGCPNSKIAKPEFTGAIYRIRKKEASPVADARGLKIDWPRLTTSDLAALLADKRPAVSERALDLLAQHKNEAVPGLARVIAEAPSPVALSALWALRRIETEEATTVLRTALTHTNTDVKRAAIRAVGGLNDILSLNLLLPLLKETDLSLKQGTATAIGRILARHHAQIPEVIQQRVVAAIFAQIEKPEIDRLTEHSLIFALIRLNQSQPVAVYLQHEKPVLRRAALIALDQMPDGHLTREQVTALLNTQDPVLQQEILTVISSHEGWASETLGLLEKWLQDPKLSDERATVLRSFLVAQSGDSKVQELIATNFKKTSPANRQLLLEVISASQLPKLPGAWAPLLTNSLESDDPQTSLLAVRSLDRFDSAPFEKNLKQLVASETRPAAVRVEATRILARQLAECSDKLFRFVLSQLDEDLLPLERLSAARTLSVLPLDKPQYLELIDHLEEAGPVARPVLIRSFTRTKDEEIGLKLVTALANLSGNIAAEQLGLVFRNYPASVQKQVALQLSSTETNLAEHKALLDKLDPLTTGGDAGSGKSVFFGKKAACSGCHAIKGKGGRIGPDLSQIGAIRTGRDLMEAIVFPSASFAREFNSYLIVTDEGLVHAGVISRETPTAIYLRKADLSEVRIPQDNIEEMQESKISIMPKDLDKAMTPAELRDLIAYLKEQTKP